jgi:predicted ferric reductase
MTLGATLLYATTALVLLTYVALEIEYRLRRWSA